MATEPDAGSDTERRWQLTTSARDLGDLSRRLTEWLGPRVGSVSTPVITAISRPEAGGMSSSSVLFEASWEGPDGAAGSGSYVARMAPEEGAFPVFQHYDLDTQYRVIAAVAEYSDIPVPPLCWLEHDASVLGSPFFVMERVQGRVPEDNPPYVFVGWVFDAAPEDRMRITRATVDIIARVHAIADPAQRFGVLNAPGTSGLRDHFEAQQQWYRWALADDGYRIPLVERGFDWLERNWPAAAGPDVLNWGDARPGNIIFGDEFEPVAVLDWEMATLGPRELDVAWMIFIHRFFQDIATRFDQPGLPDYQRRDDVVAYYEKMSGHKLGDLTWYLVYAAVRHGIVLGRIKRRMIHFGEDTDTDDRDDYVMHRTLLEAMLDGTYQWD
ncbi:MAG: phosphotransferase family protein [Nocardia sp.]|nr:phosphotransferase family protein [Nocardia sp.]